MLTPHIDDLTDQDLEDMKYDCHGVYVQPIFDFYGDGHDDRDSCYTCDTDNDTLFKGVAHERLVDEDWYNETLAFERESVLV